MNWDIAGFILTAAMMIGGIIMVWFKASRDRALTEKRLDEHEEKMKAADQKIAVILVDKASCADLVKLAALVNQIEDMMIAHHTDAMAHRNTDFEKRIELLNKSIDTMATENRLDHQAIKAKIGIV